MATIRSAFRALASTMLMDVEKLVRFIVQRPRGDNQAAKDALLGIAMRARQGVRDMIAISRRANDDVAFLQDPSVSEALGNVGAEVNMVLQPNCRVGEPTNGQVQAFHVACMSMLGHLADALARASRDHVRGVPMGEIVETFEQDRPPVARGRAAGGDAAPGQDAGYVPWEV